MLSNRRSAGCPTHQVNAHTRASPNIHMEGSDTSRDTAKLEASRGQNIDQHIKRQQFNAGLSVEVALSSSDDKMVMLATVIDTRTLRRGEEKDWSDGQTVETGNSGVYHAELAAAKNQGRCGATPFPQRLCIRQSHATISALTTQQHAASSFLPLPGPLTRNPRLKLFLVCNCIRQVPASPHHIQSNIS